MSKSWVNADGKRLVSSEGKRLLCDECPCGFYQLVQCFSGGSVTKYVDDASTTFAHGGPETSWDDFTAGDVVEIGGSTPKDCWSLTTTTTPGTAEVVTVHEKLADCSACDTSCTRAVDLPTTYTVTASGQFCCDNGVSTSWSWSGTVTLQPISQNYVEYDSGESTYSNNCANDPNGDRIRVFLTRDPNKNDFSDNCLWFLTFEQAPGESTSASAITPDGSGDYEQAGFGCQAPYFYIDTIDAVVS